MWIGGHVQNAFVPVVSLCVKYAELRFGACKIRTYFTFVAGCQLFFVAIAISIDSILRDAFENDDNYNNNNHK